MADYEYRNQAFDYAPPSRGGSGAGGALLFVVGIIALFVIAVAFMGGGGDGAAVAPEAEAPVAAPTPTVPATD